MAEKLFISEKTESIRQVGFLGVGAFVVNVRHLRIIRCLGM